VGGCSTAAGARKVMDLGFDFVQMGRALLTDPAFVNRIAATPVGEDLDSGCEHTNYCIARMYSREMACHHCLWDTLPKSIQREITKIKRKNGYQ
jgi:2,4-dienoyl-CoA reductase-like NADH-dependent reductase (Old Yellow Enzyme family)